ncbi:VCBS domain-containing protein [Bradyrhizobium sp. 137]|nr:VCBS domain-containing protein [Bradyrhizobium sp. 137]
MNADGTASSTTLPAATSEALIHAVQAAPLSDSTNGNIGEISWNFGTADHYFDFLAAGESLSETYDVAVTDDHGARSIEPVTIVVNGGHDNPVAVRDTNGIAKGTILSVFAAAGALRAGAQACKGGHAGCPACSVLCSLHRQLCGRGRLAGGQKGRYPPVGV